MYCFVCFFPFESCFFTLLLLFVFPHVYLQHCWVPPSGSVQIVLCKQKLYFLCNKLYCEWRFSESESYIWGIWQFLRYQQNAFTFLLILLLYWRLLGGLAGPIQLQVPSLSELTCKSRHDFCCIINIVILLGIEPKFRLRLTGGVNLAGWLWVNCALFKSYHTLHVVDIYCFRKSTMRRYQRDISTLMM